MNKYIEKKSFRDKPVYLSKTDRIAYIISYILILILTLFVALLYLTVKSVIAFWDDNILATADNVGVWWVIPLCLFVLGHAVYIDINYRWKDVPIFSRKTKLTVPIAEKDHVAERRKSKKAKKIFIHILLFLICIIISLPGLFNRASIDTNGTLHSYNSFNQKTSEISVDELVSLTVKATVYRRRMPEDTDFWLTLHYSDGEEYTFYTTSFNTTTDDFYSEALSDMIKLKELVPKEKIRIIGIENLGEVIELYEFEGKQTKLLYELFEVK